MRKSPTRPPLTSLSGGLREMLGRYRGQDMIIFCSAARVIFSRSAWHRPSLRLWLARSFFGHHIPGETM